MLTRTHPIFSISAKQSEVSIGFLGGGVMAKAMLSGIIASGWNPTTISLTDPKPRNLETLQQHYHGLCVSTDNQLAVKDKDVIILAVKPQVAPTAIPPLVSCLKEEQIVLSVMAGYDLEKLESLLGGHKRTVRVMPNTPSLIGKGATVYCASQACSEKDIQLTEAILSALGICSYVPEASFNAATAVSGCGPAYVFMFIEAMADAGVAKGLPRAVALKLAAQTVMGAGAMVLETGQHPGVLKDNVCSPGGVTIAGVTGLEEAGLRGAVVKGVKCAAARADEMTSRN